MADTIRLFQDSVFWFDARYIGIVNLDSTHFVVAYRDQTSDDHGKAVIGTIDSNYTISWGTIAEFNAYDTQFIDVAALDSTHFVVTYKNNTAGDPSGVAIVGTVSGDTITYGAKNKFFTDFVSYTSVSALDSAHFVTTFREETGTFDGSARVGAVSGNTITSYGAINNFATGSVGRNDVVSLDSTHFVVVYRGSARVGLVSGTTISSYGTAASFNTSGTDHHSVDMFDNTRFVVAYDDADSGGNPTVSIGNVSGTTISSFGSESAIESSSSQYTSVGVLDSTHFVVVYQDSVYNGIAIIGNVSGSTVGSYGTRKVMETNPTTNLCCAVLDSEHFITAYNNSGTSVARLATISPLNFVPTIIIT